MNRLQNGIAIQVLVRPDAKSLTLCLITLQKEQLRELKQGCTLV